MNILLDECTPRLVKRRLPQFFIRTAQEMGWTGIKNGKLLNLAEGQFEVLISTDQNLPFQQNLSGKSIAVIILPSNKVPIVAQLMPAIEQALKTFQPGTFIEIPLPYLTRAEIRSALWKSRALVKTSVMRQTLHLIPAQDFSIYISALKKSRLAALWKMMSRFGIAPKEIDALNAAVMEALRNGPLPQRELTQRIQPRITKNVRAWMAKTWSVFRPALVEGLICYGPEQGHEAVFVRVDQWLPKLKIIAEANAKQILLRRYLQAYGPATLQDFARWMGMTIPETKEVWEQSQDELVAVDCADGKKFILREDYGELRDAPLTHHVLRLLPHFDVYLLGHADKNHLLDSAHYKQVYRNQGWISPVILLDGRIIGVWSYTRRAKHWLLEIEPFEKFSKMLQAKIEEEAARLGEFLETTWEIKFNKR